jgi:hypothetical protein
MKKHTDDNLLIAVADIASRVYNLSEFIQEYTMLFNASGDEIERILLFVYVIKELSTIESQELIISIANIIQKREKHGS